MPCARPRPLLASGPPRPATNRPLPLRVPHHARLIRRIEKPVFVLGDALASSLALAAVAAGPPAWDWLPDGPGAPLAVVVGWGLLFAFAGLYADRYARGRLDELATLARVVVVGALALLFGVVVDQLQGDSLRAAIAGYAAVQFLAVGGVRLALRSAQRALVVRGYGRHRAVVVGWSDRVETLYHDLAAYPAADIDVVGAVRLRAPSAVPVLVGEGGTIEERYPGGDALPSGAVEVTASGAPLAAVAELPGLIDRLGVQDVLIALGPDDTETLDEVLRVCDGKPVTLKLVPDFYAVVGGMARTEHTYGLPLIEVLPEPMPPWERRTKRLVDVVVSAAVLAAAAPVWLAVAALVRATSPGPAVYRQTRVGRHGEPFTMLKFRTMVDGAETETGPVWAEHGDRRVTPVGRWLRRVRADEVPQLWNVLRGQMSLVGPRPERPFFVDRLRDQIPLYSRRHRVQPGITGLAQVHLRYDDSLDDVRQKLKYDLFYIETMSLGLDAKILFRTVRTALAGAGR